MAHLKCTSSKRASLLTVAAIVLCATTASAQSAKDTCGPTPVIPLTSEEPPAKIVIDPPLAGPLASRGVVIIQYCAQNLHLAPVFGPNALAVSPRLGHLHVRVDDASWVWAAPSALLMMRFGRGLFWNDKCDCAFVEGVMVRVLQFNEHFVRTGGKTHQDDAIRPFHVNVPEADLTELRGRISATKWPERETVTDASQGVQLATIQALARYWGTEYDSRKIEARMNALPQFITGIDGLDIHFIHVRSKHENALPLIVTHGWPGSIIEQMKIIDPLTNPTAHGGSASDAFHVVIPSMPGYGFSGRPATTGWDAPHIARAWVVLMKRLGYTKFVAQGGDWGAVITELMGVQAPPELLGIHTNMANVIPLDIDKLAFSGAPAPANLSADEKLAYERLSFVYAKGIGYGFQMGLRPQTLYGIADSPIGLAAYFLDHDARSYEMIARVFARGSEGLTRDDVLDNITLTWLTNTALSGARLYWENKGASFFAVKGVVVPTAVSVFPDELYPAPGSWAERAYPKLIHYNRAEKGGHFAAWEQPQLFSEEVRAGFRSLR